MTTWHDLLHCPRDGGTLAAEAVAGPATFRCMTCGLSLAPAGGVYDVLSWEGGAAVEQAGELELRDREAEGYDDVRLRIAGGLDLAHVGEGLTGPSGGAALDLGAGTGRVTEMLWRRFARVVALDFSSRSLELCRRKHAPARGDAACLFLRGGVERVPLADGRFDLVVSNDVLQYVPRPEARQAALDEAARVLRPGGRLVLNVYNYNLRHRLGPQDGRHSAGLPYHRFRPSELLEMVARAGFTNAEARPILNSPFGAGGGLALDRWLSRLPFAGLLGRSLLLTARR
ncbi:MAG: class I SAM-dependent methyltransferase [Planctomycetes bacterium]|nr:class I SAM-dependent methyltransferase [Planctomycetota bacterium]